MLILLSHKLNAHTISHKSDMKDLVCLIKKLYQAHIDKIHYIHCEINCIDLITSLERLDPEIKVILNVFKKNKYDFNAFLEQGFFYIEFTITDNHKVLKSSNHLSIGYKFYNSPYSEVYSRAVLVCENFDDSNIYYSWSKHKFSSLLRKFNSNIELDHGAGSNSASKVNNLISDKRTFLIVTDSDKDCPSCPKPSGGVSDCVDILLSGRENDSICIHFTNESIRTLENYFTPSFWKIDEEKIKKGLENYKFLRIKKSNKCIKNDNYCPHDYLIYDQNLFAKNNPQLSEKLNFQNILPQNLEKLDPLLKKIISLSLANKKITS